MIPHPTHGRDGRPTNARGGILLDPFSSTSSARTPFSPSSITSPTTSATTGAPTHPAYLLRITILGTHNPTITRLLAIPAAATAHDLHRAMQVAFGWTLGAASAFWVFDFDGVEDIPTAKPIPDERTSFGPQVARRWSRKVGVGELLAGSRGDDDDDNNNNNNPASHPHNVSNAYNGHDDDPSGRHAASPPARHRTSNVHVEYLYGAGDSTWHHAVEPLGRVQLREAGYGISGRGRAGAPSAGGDPRRAICVGGEGHAAAEEAFGAEGWEGEVKAAYGYRGLDDEDEVEVEDGGAFHAETFRGEDWSESGRGRRGGGGYVAYSDGRRAYDGSRPYADAAQCSHSTQRAHPRHGYAYGPTDEDEDEDEDVSDAALRHWYETACTNGDPLGLANGRVWCWDRDEVNRRLALLPGLEDLSDRRAREVSVAFAGVAMGRERRRGEVSRRR